MTRENSRPTVFVGSSTPALAIAEKVKRGLSPVANVVVWNTAFDSGTWLLGGILNQAQQSDFGVFVIRADDIAAIKGTEYVTVNDNVLFEAGVFMGALGPKRTILLWPSQCDDKLRLPSDLDGLLREIYTSPQSEHTTPQMGPALASIRRRIESMGPALRSGYNEIAALEQTLYERDLEFDDGTCESVLAVIQRAARKRKRPWFSATSVKILTDAIAHDFEHDIVNQVFWWLILYGVIAFDNIEVWTEGDWETYEESLEYTAFTHRGLVLLNELRTKTKVNQQRTFGAFANTHCGRFNLLALLQADVLR